MKMQCAFITNHDFPLFWSGRRVSNSRPQPWQGCALPTELLPHQTGIIYKKRLRSKPHAEFILMAHQKVGRNDCRMPHTSRQSTPFAIHSTAENLHCVDILNSLPEHACVAIHFLRSSASVPRQREQRVMVSRYCSAYTRPYSPWYARLLHHA